MPAQTYDLIASTTISTATGTVTFNSIPQTYNDLVMVLYGRSNVATSGSVQSMIINNDTQNGNYNYLQGGGYNSGTAVSTEASSYSSIFLGRIPSANNPANYFGTIIANIPNYTGSTRKTCLIHNGSMTNNTSPNAALVIAANWVGTNAITRLDVLEGNGGNWISGTQVSLYGIKRE